MSRTNRLEAVERKIGHLLAEQEELGSEIDKAEALIERLPQMRDRLWEIGTIIKAAGAFIKDDHPDWTGSHIQPVRKWVHKNPIKLGQLTKGALAILRDSDEPLTCRDVAIKLLDRSQHENPTRADMDAVANAVQVAFAKRRGTVIHSDGGWPEYWHAVKPE